MARNLPRYEERLNRVAAFISDALEAGQTPTVNQLANAFALSSFHFHRVYRLLTGETVGQALQRLKVAHALRLVSEGVSVTTAAHTAGYDSSQNLAKAVRQRAGASVSELRAAGTIEDALNRLNSAQGDAPMKFEFVDHSPVQIVCRTVIGPYDELNLGYRSLANDVARSLGSEAITGVFGIPIDDARDVLPAEHGFTCALSVAGVTTQVENAQTRLLGGGGYAKRQVIAPYSALPEAIDLVYCALLRDGRELGDRECFIHYVDQPTTADGPNLVHVSDIYVPVQS